MLYPFNKKGCGAGVQQHAINTIYVKKNTTLIKMIVPHFDKKRVALLWFASGFFAGSVSRCFLPNMPRFLPMCHDFCQHAAIWRNAPHFTRKVLQSKDCGALQDGALSGIASKGGTHRAISAVHGTPR